MTLFDVLRFLDRGKRAVEGEAIARELITTMQKLGGGHDDMHFGPKVYEASFTSMQGRLDESEAMFLSLLPQEQSADRLDRARLHLAYGRHLVRRRQFEKAEQELNTAVGFIDDVRKGTWETHPDDVILGFIELYKAWGKQEKAEEYHRMHKSVIRP